MTSCLELSINGPPVDSDLLFLQTLKKVCIMFHIVVSFQLVILVSTIKAVGIAQKLLNV